MVIKSFIDRDFLILRLDIIFNIANYKELSSMQLPSLSLTESNPGLPDKHYTAKEPVK